MRNTVFISMGQGQIMKGFKVLLPAVLVLSLTAVVMAEGDSGNHGVNITLEAIKLQ